MKEEILVFWLGNKRFGIRISEVSEIVSLDGPFVEVPVKGTRFGSIGQVQVRERVLPVLNLRQLLGQSSWQQYCSELSKLLSEREEDHRKWITELEACVREGRNFSLSLDGNGCAFGRWYNQFKTHDRRLGQMLKLFDIPHKKIHALGRDILELATRSGKEAALERISQLRQAELSELLNLFAKTREILAIPVEPIGIMTRDLVLPVDNVETIQSGELDTDGRVYVMGDGGLVPALQADLLRMEAMSEAA